MSTNIYPTPQQIGIKIPQHLIEKRFCDGFLHALKGGHLRDPENFRLSFREGFRCAKLYLKEVRRSRGILDFPMKAKVAFRNVA